MRKLTISAKCSDTCFATLDNNGDRHEREGYVPRGMGIGGGDYIEFSIDLDTGTILNWTVPSKDTLEEFKDND